MTSSQHDPRPGQDDAIGGDAREDGSGPAPQYKHREAYCLMWYACRECGHRERFWNSRDGVTPFGTRCPSCDNMTLMHVDWHLDELRPNHRPHHGQKLWAGMTLKYAEALVDRTVVGYVKARGCGLTESERIKLLRAFWRGGDSPMMLIHGFDEYRS